MKNDPGTEQFLKTLDYGAIGVTVSTLLGWLPHVAAILSVVWLVYRIKTQILEKRIKELELKKLEGQSGVQ